MIEKLIKGDSEVFACDLDIDITDWKIRAELSDESKNSIKLATTNSGGSDDEVEITDALTGKFQIKIKAGTTTNFADKAKLEIEVETTNIVGGIPEIRTIFQGDIMFKCEKIKWTSPS